MTEATAATAFNYTHLPSLAGVPAGAVPFGRDGRKPVGVQVTAAPFREDVALAVMRVLHARGSGRGVSAAKR